MMYVLSLILFLIIFHQLYVYNAEKNDSDNYLPLVFVIQENKFQYPDQLIKAIIDKNLGFTGDTQFAKGDKKDQAFFCPAESREQFDKIERYNDLIKNSSYRLKKHFGDKEAGKDCLFSKTFKKTDALTCATDATPLILPVKIGEPGEEKIVFCGPNKKSKHSILFKFTNEICVPISTYHRILSYGKSILRLNSEITKFVAKLPFWLVQETVYEVCYDRSKRQTVYTRHKPASGKLLFNEDLQHEKNKQFEMMTTVNDYLNEDEFSRLIELYDRLMNPTDENQSPNDERPDAVKTHDVYFAEKLAPPDDFAIAALKKSTFHFINVKPMHKKLVDLWNYIANLIRENFKDSENENPIDIYTGAFTPTKSEYNEVPENWPSDVPFLWIKIIYQETPNPFRSPSLAIIMKNDIQPREVENDIEPGEEPNTYDHALDRLCYSADYCKPFKKNVQVIDRFSHLLEKIRCCPYNYRIHEFFSIYPPRGNNLLSIADLTDPE